MKKKRFLYGALALVSYLIFVVALTPADRLYGLVKDKLPLALYQLDGSVWQGRAAVATAGNPPQRLESLKWELQPAALLLGRAEAAVSFKYDSRNVAAVVGRDPGGLFLRELKGSLAAKTMETFAPQLAFGLSGLFQIDFEEVALDGAQLRSAEGTIRWRDAGIELNNTSFGNFELVLTTTDGVINGAVRDIDGPLKVNGTLQLQPSGEYLFAGTVALRDQQRNDLRQGLRFVGKPDSKGAYTVKHQGQLPIEKLAAIAG